MRARDVCPMCLLLVGSLWSTTSSAAETDPYYAWIAPPPDSTRQLNRRTNELMNAALRDVNRSWLRDRLSCDDVARAITRPFLPTAMWFFVGTMDGYGLRPTPRSNTEYMEHYTKRGIYRFSHLWKWGFIVPPDPTLRVAETFISPDKVAHFFHEGWQYYKVYRSHRQRGATHDEAHQAAIWDGIDDENMIQGDVISGIFSYADLEANEQGFQFYKSLCEGDDPVLVRVGEHWTLSKPFDFRDWVNPCWDEAFYVSAFSPHVATGVRRALRDYCGYWQSPDVQDRFARYRALGCHSYSFHFLERLSAASRIPDRTPNFIDEVCTSTRAPSHASEATGGDATPPMR